MSPPQHVHPGRGGSSRPSPDLYMSRGASTCPLQQAAHCCACDLQLRKQLDLHVNLVHGFSMSGLPTRHKDVIASTLLGARPFPSCIAIALCHIINSAGAYNAA